MDNKITKKRFADMWAYDWIKMLGAIAAAVFFWVLLFDVLAPRLLAGQDFSVFTYATVRGNASDKLYDELKKEKVLSYDVLQLNVTTFEKKYIGQLMSTRAATHEGDILILDKNTVKREIVFEGENKKEYVFGSFQTTVDGYSIYDIDKLLKDALTYYASFTTKYADKTDEITDFDALAAELKADAENEILDRDIVLQKFKKRKKKDNAYKTEAQYKSGAEKDVERLVRLKTDTIKVYEVLHALDGIYTFETNPLRANYRKFEYSYFGNLKEKAYEEAYEKETLKTYGIDLGGIDRIVVGGKRVYKETRRVGEDYKVYSDNGVYETIPETSSGADGVTVCVFDYRRYQPDLQYETVSFLRYIFDTYMNCDAILA